jgi:dTDP-4-amino-4,6-dideoxygalactose transaminase
MMQIPALDLKRQIALIRQELDAAIKEVIDQTGFILGAKVEQFEQHIAEYSGAGYAVGVSNGTDAISLSLLALGIGAGDGVICPAFTYYATAGAVANIGAYPVFVDIDEDTYNISLSSIEKALAKKRKFKIKAIIPMHLYGCSADLDGILKLAHKHKIKVIEDTAQGFGADYKGKKCGTCGDCGSVSFYPGKNLGAFGDAGLVLTNNKSTAEKLKILRNQGNKNRYYHLVLGRNCRLDTIQAAVLDVKLKYLDRWNMGRREVAEYYSKNLAGLGLKLPAEPHYSTHIYHQYVVRAAVSNKALMSHLQSKGIDSRIFYPLPLHLQKCFKYLGYRAGDFPQAELAAKQTVALPIYPELTGQEKDYIIQSVKEFMHG